MFFEKKKEEAIFMWCLLPKSKPKTIIPWNKYNNLEVERDTE